MQQSVNTIGDINISDTLCENYKVSVIISAYTTERYCDLQKCIASLRNQVVLPYEIILVVDPDKRLKDFFSSKLPPDIKIIASEKCGLSNARNVGVKLASGNIIAFIDDDAVADRNWLKFLIVNYDDPCVVGVGGYINPIWSNKRPKWFPKEFDWIVGCSYKGLPEVKSCVRNPIGCNMSFRKDAFNHVGYFLESIGRTGKKLTAGEEAEFSIRLLNTIPNAKIIYDPFAIVHHKVPKERTSVTHFIKRSFYEGFSKAQISRKSNLNSLANLESHYSKYLLLVSFPSKLRQINKLHSMLELSAILMAILSVLIGYSACKVRSLLS
jgi:glycosyltransferase involved in cell wall biosynthesis